MITLKMFGFVLLLTISSFFTECSSVKKELDARKDKSTNERSLTQIEPSLYASTLDGDLVALDDRNGKILWKLHGQPVIKTHKLKSQSGNSPHFLPNPRDGSIYTITTQGTTHPSENGGGQILQKLPFTIPQLVTSSPCKSTDGIFYTGKKMDNWLNIDRYSGQRLSQEATSGMSDSDDLCEVPAFQQDLFGGGGSSGSPGSLLIGRSEYNIIINDKRTRGPNTSEEGGEADRSGNESVKELVSGRMWNISFYSYAAKPCDSVDDTNEEYIVNSSNGELIKIKDDQLVWDTAIDSSPVIGLYKICKVDDTLYPVKMTSMSTTSVDSLINQYFHGTAFMSREKHFKATLYLGETDNILFALPTLVDGKALVLPAVSSNPPSKSKLLIEGLSSTERDDNSPSNPSTGTEGRSSKEDLLSLPMPSKSKINIYLGHYELPNRMESKLNALSGPPDPPLLTYENQIPPMKSDDQQFYGVLDSTDWALLSDAWINLKSMKFGALLEQNTIRLLTILFRFSFHWLRSVENKELKIVEVLLATILLFMYKVFKKYNVSDVSMTSNRSSNYLHMNQSPNNSHQNSNVSNLSQNSSRGLAGGSNSYTALPQELGDGRVKVGNITFDPNHILGKGCEGTFVYSGEFDNRKVAVKRILAACFSIADREVELLRESDQHVNVIRYFCMEQDQQFRYIALEFCDATLTDLVERKMQSSLDYHQIDYNSILRQAASGLKHLHSLDIVHRDIKPHNVLLAVSSSSQNMSSSTVPNFQVRISDFGLCKKLKAGRVSFSMRSGVTGTEGWIAPEMFYRQKIDPDDSSSYQDRSTQAVDIFSLGCVFFYVLTRGHHPFGESFRRQANILSGKYDMTHLHSLAALQRRRVNRRKQCEGVLAILGGDLVEKMIASKATRRPPIDAVLKHPLFWSNSTILSFLMDVSDRVEKEERDYFVVKALEENKDQILDGCEPWWLKMPRILRDDLRTHRTYKGNSIVDLLRALRNKRHHYTQLSDEVRDAYGHSSCDYTLFWVTRFPRLPLHVWHSIHCVRSEPILSSYFHSCYAFLPSNSFINSQNADPKSRFRIPDDFKYPWSSDVNLFSNDDPPADLESISAARGEVSPVVSFWEDRINNSQSFHTPNGQVMPTTVQEQNGGADPVHPHMEMDHSEEQNFIDEDVTGMEEMDKLSSCDEVNDAGALKKKRKRVRKHKKSKNIKAKNVE